MLNKEKLQAEIFSIIEYTQNFFYGKFINPNVNKSFDRYLGEKNKRMQISCGISSLCFYGYMIFNHIWGGHTNLLFYLMSIIIAICYTILFVIMIMTDKSSKLNHICSILKYIFIFQYAIISCYKLVYIISMINTLSLQSI